jgi:hypothetical protein
MCSEDGDIPLYLRVGDGNESDSAMFATIIADYYQVDASLQPKEIAIAIETKRAARFILATNVLNTEELSNDHQSTTQEF